MRALILSAAVVSASLVAVSPQALAGDPDGPGFELGVRTGYAFSAGETGAVPNGNDANLGDYVSGQWPFWLDVGYRFDPSLYLGAYLQYGFGVVNDDVRTECRNANADCSASDTRLGIMGRYRFAPIWKLAPWAGLGIGYEWGSYSYHLSTAITNLDVGSSWSGWEFANLQAGADYRLAPQFSIAPFISVSIDQFQSTTTTTAVGNTTNPNTQDLAKKSIHEWIMIGARVSFSP
jgi:opacity protein-like surface antigen